VNLEQTAAGGWIRWVPHPQMDDFFPFLIHMDAYYSCLSFTSVYTVSFLSSLFFSTQEPLCKKLQSNAKSRFICFHVSFWCKERGVMMKMMGLEGLVYMVTTTKRGCNSLVHVH
jgi:hypothetical protein